jgi:hypothetical protein
MDRREQDHWKDEALHVVLEAVASDPDLRRILVLKGARALGRLLPGLSRMSLDIDAGLTGELGTDAKEPRRMADRLQALFERAVRTQIQDMDPLVYDLGRVAVDPVPPNGHPFGWQGYLVKIALQDRRRPGVLGIPALQLDVTAEEDLGPAALTTLDIGGQQIQAYSMTRQTAEKLRAFLESLPAHRSKIGSSRAKSVRVKDIADICRIVEHHPLSDEPFWSGVGAEFRRACLSRYVDCREPATFRQDLAVTARTYQDDTTLRGEPPFDAAWNRFETVLARLDELSIFPVVAPLPDGLAGH